MTKEEALAVRSKWVNDSKLPEISKQLTLAVLLWLGREEEDNLYRLVDIYVPPPIGERTEKDDEFELRRYGRILVAGDRNT